MPAAARVRPPSHPRHLVNCAVVFTSVEAVAFLWAGFPGAEAAGDCYSGWRGLTNKYEGLQLWVRACTAPCAPRAGGGGCCSVQQRAQ